MKDWVVCMCETWLIYMCTMTHLYVYHASFVCYGSFMYHDSFICVTWLIFMCIMTHLYVYHDSFRCVTWLIHMCTTTHSYVCRDSFVCVSWPICMCTMTCSCTMAHSCTMTHSYLGKCMTMKTPPRTQNSFICVTWTHPYVWYDALVYDVSHDSFVCVLIRMGAVSNSCVTWTHPYVWYDSLVYDVSHDSFVCVLIRMGAVSNSYVWHMWHDSFKCVTWLIHMCDWHIRVCGMSVCSYTGKGKTGLAVKYMCTMTHWCVTWRFHTRDMTYSYLRSFVWVPLSHSYSRGKGMAIATATWGRTQQTATHCNTLQHTATHR